MFAMVVLYMIDGFLRLGNLLYSNYVVQCPSEVYTLYYFICDEVCGVNQIDLDYIDFVGLNDPAVKSLSLENTAPPLSSTTCTRHTQLLPFFTKSALPLCGQLICSLLLDTRVNIQKQHLLIDLYLSALLSRHWIYVIY